MSMSMSCMSMSCMSISMMMNDEYEYDDEYELYEYDDDEYELYENDDEHEYDYELYEYVYEYEYDDNDEDIYRYQGSHSSVCVEICWKGVCAIHMIEMIIITVFQTLDCQL